MNTAINEQYDILVDLNKDMTEMNNTLESMLIEYDIREEDEFDRSRNSFIRNNPPREDFIWDDFYGWCENDNYYEED